MLELFCRIKSDRNNYAKYNSPFQISFAVWTVASALQSTIQSWWGGGAGGGGRCSVEYMYHGGGAGAGVGVV